MGDCEGRFFDLCDTLKIQITNYKKALDQESEGNVPETFKALSDIYVPLEKLLRQISEKYEHQGIQAETVNDAIQKILALLTEPAKKIMEDTQAFDSLLFENLPFRVEDSPVLRIRFKKPHRINMVEMDREISANKLSFSARTRKDFMTFDLTVQGDDANQEFTTEKPKRTHEYANFTAVNGRLEVTTSAIDQEPIIEEAEKIIENLMKNLHLEQQRHVLFHINGIELDYLHSCYEQALMDKVPEWGTQWGTLELLNSARTIHLERKDQEIAITYATDFTPAFSSPFGTIKHNDALCIRMESQVTIRPEKVPEYAPIKTVISLSQ